MDNNADPLVSALTWPAVRQLAGSRYFERGEDYFADERQKDHPEDAIPVYQRQIESTLAHTNRQAYTAAIRLLHRVYEAMARLHLEAEFESYVQEIRAKHKRKRNFMAMLSETKW